MFDDNSSLTLKSSDFDLDLIQDPGEISNSQGVPLGINTSIVTPYKGQTNLGLAYKRLDVIAQLWHDMRSGWCQRSTLPGFNRVDLVFSQQRQRARFGNLMCCGSAWSCPICSARIAFHRAKELMTIDLTDFEVSMVTVTLRHNSQDKLKDLIFQLKESWRKFRMGKPYEKHAALYGIIGSIVSTEILYGSNGWHPHLHVLYISKVQLDDEFLAWSRDRWLTKLHQVGADALYEIGFNLTVEMERADYITKLLDVETGEVTVKNKWTLGDEITLGQLKKKSSGMQPFSLLDLALVNRTAADLYREYYESTMGRNKLTWSRGLKAKFKLQDKSDDVLAYDKELDDVLIWSLNLHEWLEVLRLGLRSELLEFAQANQDLPFTIGTWLQAHGINYEIKDK